MDYHHHARLTIHRREELAQTVIQGRLSLPLHLPPSALPQGSTGLAPAPSRRFGAGEHNRLRGNKLNLLLGISCWNRSALNLLRLGNIVPSA
jgi:hypothetical protein